MFRRYSSCWKISLVFPVLLALISSAAPAFSQDFNEGCDPFDFDPLAPACNPFAGDPRGERILMCQIEQSNLLEARLGELQAEFNNCAIGTGLVNTVEAALCILESGGVDLVECVGDGAIGEAGDIQECVDTFLSDQDRAVEETEEKKADCENQP